MISIRSRIKFFLSRTNSYSQYGEDNIILSMIDLYKIENPKYMDIGAHHPFRLSNTALLYRYGITGTNIEPDPYLFKEFIKERKRDLNLNIGIHKDEGEMTFFQFNKPEYNTFSKSVAEQYEKQGIVKTGEIQVKVDTYNNIIDKYLAGIAPDILFCDAEGLDETIIYSINYKIFSPKIICIETYAYGIGSKNENIIHFLRSKKFSLHADTFVNSIFIKL